MQNNFIESDEQIVDKTFPNRDVIIESDNENRNINSNIDNSNNNNNIINNNITSINGNNNQSEHNQLPVLGFQNLMVTEIPTSIVKIYFIIYYCYYYYLYLYLLG